MLRLKILSLALCGCLILGIMVSAAAAEVDCDDVYCFESGDFSDDSTLTGISSAVSSPSSASLDITCRLGFSALKEASSADRSFMTLSASAIS